MPDAEQIRNKCTTKINAELVYSDYSLFLRIKNNSDDSIYVQTNIFNNDKILYNGKRVYTNFLYNYYNLPPLPDPELYDSLDQTTPGVAAYINCPNPKEADSLLLRHILGEYQRINIQKEISSEEFSLLTSDLDFIMLLAGSIIFLPPHDSYTYEYNYSCFKRLPGTYKVKCKEAKKYKLDYVYARGISDNTTIKIPYIPPFKFMGFTRYDSRLKCKTIKFTTE